MLGKLFNLRALPKNLVRRKVIRYVNEVCERLGPERIEWMLQNKKSISAFVTDEQLAQIRLHAPSFRWAEQSIGNQEFVSMLPSWVADAVKRHGNDGKEWEANMIQWIRAFFY